MQPQPLLDQRQHPRRDARLVVRYRPKEPTAGYDITQTRNISQGGMLLTTARAFEAGERLAIQARLPVRGSPRMAEGTAEAIASRAGPIEPHTLGQLGDEPHAWEPTVDWVRPFNPCQRQLTLSADRRKRMSLARPHKGHPRLSGVLVRRDARRVVPCLSACSIIWLPHMPGRPFLHSRVTIPPRLLHSPLPRGPFRATLVPYAVGWLIRLSVKHSMELG